MWLEIVQTVCETIQQMQQYEVVRSWHTTVQVCLAIPVIAITACLSGYGLLKFLDKVCD
jgi:hypothetical protein